MDDMEGVAPNTFDPQMACRLQVRDASNEVEMITTSFLKIKYRQAATILQQIALAGLPVPMCVALFGQEGKTGRIRLKAAHRLQR